MLLRNGVDFARFQNLKKKNKIQRGIFWLVLSSLVQEICSLNILAAHWINGACFVIMCIYQDSKSKQILFALVKEKRKETRKGLE